MHHPSDNENHHSIREKQREDLEEMEAEEEDLDEGEMEVENSLNHKRKINAEDEQDVANVSRKIKRLRLPSHAEETLGLIKIKIKTLSGKEIDLMVNLYEPISRLKDKIAEREGIPAEQQRLVFQGKTIADERSIDSYDVKEGECIFLVLALRGGIWNFNYT
jgi:ubiquitin-like protein Nedd8